jgi:tetratricopeptide (TPR) repeat protein
MELIKAMKSAYREVECLEEVRAGLKSNPPRTFRVELEFQLIEQLMVVGEVEQAKTEIAILERIEGKSARLQSKVIDVLRTEGRLEEALAALSELFPHVQDLSVAYLTRGVIYLDLRNYDEAAHDLERVVAAEPFNEGAQFKLSEAYRGLGKVELALKHREIGMRIREKRIRIIAIMKQQSSMLPTRHDCDELSLLYSELGAPAASQYWKQRAGYADNW